MTAEHGLLDPSGWSYLQRIFSRKLILWGSFITVLWLLRDFFALFLFSFVIGYLASSLTDRLTPLVRQRRRLAVVLVYLAFIAAITMLCIIIIPSVSQEVRNLIQDLQRGQIVSKSTDAVEGFIARLNVWFGVEPKALQDGIRSFMPDLTKSVISTTTSLLTGLIVPIFYFLLAMLLSFFMVLDLPNIRRQVHTLENSRLRDYYLDVYPGVIAFFSLLGQGFEAQTIVALVNTAITALGLAILGVPNIAMLAVIVFCASYIPVLGMWLSTVPMVIVALANKDFQTGFEVIGLVSIVHLLEAYVINPRIYGAHMHLHPLMVLIILILGEHLVGVWGLVLGVPVWTYVWRYVVLGTTDDLWVERRVVKP